ncbi:hypothetical protein ACJWDR_01260 [Streptomyces tauricus]
MGISSAERVCSTAAGSASRVGKYRQSVSVPTQACSVNLSREAPTLALWE